MADQCFHINGAWLHMDLHRLHRRSIPIRPRLPHTGGSNTPALNKPLANSDPPQDLAARDIPLGLRATVLAIPMLGRSTTLLCLLPNLNRTAEMVITQWQVSRLILKMTKATRSSCHGDLSQAQRRQTLQATETREIRTDKNPHLASSGKPKFPLGKPPR